MRHGTVRGTKPPQSFRFRLLAILALTLAALAFTACSGGGDDEGDATASTTATATRTATATATPTDTPEPVDDDRIVRSPNELDSYRYTVEMSLDPRAVNLDQLTGGIDLGTNVSLNLEGTVVNPDREQTKTSIQVGLLALNTETIRIGDDQWTRSGSGNWEPAVAASGPEDLLGGGALSPASIFEGDDAVDYEGISKRLSEYDYTEEDVNGVNARHYQLDEAAFSEVFATQGSILPAGIEADLNADVWLATQLGVPVRLVVVATSTDGDEVARLTMDVTDINDEFTIEAP